MTLGDNSIRTIDLCLARNEQFNQFNQLANCSFLPYGSYFVARIYTATNLRLLFKFNFNFFIAWRLSVVKLAHKSPHSFFSSEACTHFRCSLLIIKKCKNKILIMSSLWQCTLILVTSDHRCISSVVIGSVFLWRRCWCPESSKMLSSLPIFFLLFSLYHLFLPY